MLQGFKAELFKALGHPVRIRILELLREGEQSVSSLSESLAIEMSTVSQHLAILRTVNHGTGDHTKGNHWMLTGFEGPAFNAPDNKEQPHPDTDRSAPSARPADRPNRSSVR